MLYGWFVREPCMSFSTLRNNKITESISKSTQWRCALIVYHFWPCWKLWNYAENDFMPITTSYRFFFLRSTKTNYKNNLAVFRLCWRFLFVFKNHRKIFQIYFHLLWTLFSLVRSVFIECLFSWEAFIMLKMCYVMSMPSISNSIRTNRCKMCKNLWEIVHRWKLIFTFKHFVYFFHQKHSSNMHFSAWKWLNCGMKGNYWSFRIFSSSVSALVNIFVCVHYSNIKRPSSNQNSLTERPKKMHWMQTTFLSY